MSASNAESLAELGALRAELESLDNQLIEVIARRVAISRRIGRAKRAAGQPLLDPSREAAVVRRASTLAGDAGLAVEDVREIFWHLIGLCRRAQEEE